MKSYPSKLYVETTTRCNLRCSMCVKQTQGACIPETDMDMDVFRAMAPAFPHLDGLILNGIGEPLLSRNLTEMIRTARQAMRPDAEIGFQSNGLLLTRNRARQLVDAGLDTICLSVDTVTEDSISHGGEDVGRVASAFAYLREASEASGRPLRIGVEFVLMRETAEALPRSLAWAAEQGAQFALVTHVLPYAEAVVDQDLFNPNTDASMAEFARWRKEADARGLDLSKYYGLPWKFHKTDEESRLVRFVVKRQKAALARNIPIHFNSLLEWTSPKRQADRELVASVLAEARRVGDEHGLELTLPPLEAFHKRHCEFVEQGIAHVTPTGDVRPCYFLWHKYSCFMDGHVKNVEPVTLGNVCDTSILDIWNSEAYREFRAEVLEYDYPYCSNCSVVPCSDVTGQGRSFEHDCHGIHVPCGHCVWCMGGVRCMV